MKRIAPLAFALAVWFPAAHAHADRAEHASIALVEYVAAVGVAAGSIELCLVGWTLGPWGAAGSCTAAVLIELGVAVPLGVTGSIHLQAAISGSRTSTDLWFPERTGLEIIRQLVRTVGSCPPRY